MKKITQAKPEFRKFDFDEMAVLIAKHTQKRARKGTNLSMAELARYCGCIKDVPSKIAKLGNAWEKLNYGTKIGLERRIRLYETLVKLDTGRLVFEQGEWIEREKPTRKRTVVMKVDILSGAVKTVPHHAIATMPSFKTLFGAPQSRALPAILRQRLG